MGTPSKNEEDTSDGQLVLMEHSLTSHRTPWGLLGTRETSPHCSCVPSPLTSFLQPRESLNNLGLGKMSRLDALPNLFLFEIQI